jgi:tetratricopeptide (TPR) repeat protein
LTPGSSESPLLVATAALADRRPRIALAALRDVDPDRGLNLAAPFYWKNRTAALYQLADYHGSADACNRGRRRFPKDYFLAYFCVSSLLHLNKVDRVEDLLANEELATTRAELAAHAVQVMQDIGLTAESSRLAAKWLASLPNGAEYDFSRGQLLLAAGRWVEAKSRFTRLAQVDSGVRRLRLLGTLGVVNARLQLRPEALHIDSLLASSPELAEGGEREILRARIHSQLGDLDGAVALAAAGRDKGWELLSLMNSLADDHWLAPLRPLPSFQSVIALKD